MSAFFTKSNFSFQNGAGFDHTNVIATIVIDFNQDGDLDVVAGRFYQPPATGGSVPLTFLRNDGSGHFTDATSTFFPSAGPAVIGPDNSVVVFADFNGDHRPDLFTSV